LKRIMRSQQDGLDNYDGLGWIYEGNPNQETQVKGFKPREEIYTNPHGCRKSAYVEGIKKRIVNDKKNLRSF
jgi:hypothetical protein